MPRLRKVVLNNRVYFVTLSVEEGVMLPANPLVNFIIAAALLRAYSHHKLEICHFLVNGTHIHMIVRVDNPEDLPKFMERFKTESAHYLNRILGRRKRTVWCEGYDSPILLTIQDVIDTTVYLYTNPVKDGLIDSINKFPGLSSWNCYRSGTKVIKSNLIARDSLFKIDNSGGYSYFQKMKNMLSKLNKEKERLYLAPSGWFKSFRVTSGEMEAINQEILKKINEKEQEISELRIKEKKSFVGRVRLEAQGLELDYIPMRKGKRSWTKSSDIEKRVGFISFAKSLCKEAEEIFKEYCKGDFSRKYPFGLFPPRIPVLGNLIECAV